MRLLAGSISRDVSPTSLTPLLRQQLSRRLQHAYASGSLRLVKRLHALLAIAEGMPVHDIAQMLGLGEQTVRDSLNRFLWPGVASVVSQCPLGLPAKIRLVLSPITSMRPSA